MFRYVLYAIALIIVWAWLRGVWKRTSGHPWQAFRAARGWGLDVDELARRLGVSYGELVEFRPRYRRTTIPKRNGGRRQLRVPDDPTKAMQRRILHRVLARLKSHDCAHGFEAGRSIRTNAEQHVKKRVVVRMDIVDFFQATANERVEAYFRRVGWNAEAATLLMRLTTEAGGLPQGAPTSPRLSNLVNVQLDHQIAANARYRNAVYTRYADDITISFERDSFSRVRGIIQHTRRTLKAHGYVMHEKEKLHIRRRHTQQLVTGLVVNERVRLPRRKRRWLRAVRHRLETQGTCTLTPAQLRGWSALEWMIDGPS
ncbi:MAG: reverse transcriptase family protein [Planctomycetota bacterium]|jgi:retron-type reverse transcriptase